MPQLPSALQSMFPNYYFTHKPEIANKQKCTLKCMVNQMTSPKIMA